MTKDDDNEVPITKMPADLHPFSWELSGEEAEDPSVKMLDGVRQAGADSFARWWLADKAIAADTTFTKDANDARSLEFSKKEAKRFEKAYLPAIAAADAEIKALDAKMNRVPKMPSEALALKIADRVERMSPEARRKYLTDALNNNHMSIIGAVLFYEDAPLFGITDTMRDNYRAQYREKTYPDEVRRRTYLKRRFDQLLNGVEDYQKKMGAAYNTKEIEEAQKRADRARKAME